MALQRIEADFHRSADTHLFRLDGVAALPGIDLYLKDESTHPTGSLKHRLARSLFLFAICNGWIREGTTVIEASSGSTAVSEAYFARMLNLPFIAVMPRRTSPEKVAAIRFYGGDCHFVEDPAALYTVSEALARERNGHFMDQFTYAERATDWRGNNNIAESIYRQMERERFPIPRWVVMGAGTGGTSATIGRYVRYKQVDTRLCVVDVANSVFYDSYRQGRRDITIGVGSRIEGIGRPRCEPSFVPGVVDRMERVPDAASIGAMRVLAERLGRKPGGSTGTNFYGVCRLAAEMAGRGETGSIVTLLCDPGERYLHTYYDDGWLAENGLDIAPYVEQVARFLDSGRWVEPAGA
ncbi:PLP-dependent cysteine synthase family protein [Azospirillum sp. SYSU D00513]|uniref:PLP-dependent cysteine synthase family protein n=1 Tax=Azospirillum sp. SYSU D00513 TaxID=2812561 RepID=UPI001A961D17|nr:PLP-dependent cysteine synthase family protein [Azospirillum sp. SYSU D00513]